MKPGTPCASCLRALRSGRLPLPTSTFRSTPSPTYLSAAYTSSYLLARNFASKPKHSSKKAPQPRSKPSQNADSNSSTLSPNASIALAQQLRSMAPGVTETYAAYGVCESLVKECMRVADYDIPQAKDEKEAIPKNEQGEDIGVSKGSWWHEKCGLPPSFSTWSTLTMLHLWLLTARLRAFPPAHFPTWQQHLTDHFFTAAEERMRALHRIRIGGLRQRYLKQLFERYRGAAAAYDAALAQEFAARQAGVKKGDPLVPGDALLAAALWRNVFKADEGVDVRRLAQVVSYVRGSLAGLDAMEDEVVAAGDIVFGDPGGEAALVRVKSRMMDAPFADEGKERK